MDIRTGLKTWMLADAEITAEVGKRIYQGYAPENQPRPYIILDNSGGTQWIEDTEGTQGAHSPVQVIVWADAFDSTEGEGNGVADISEIIRKKLDRFTGDLGGVNVIETCAGESAIGDPGPIDSVQLPSDSSERYLYVREMTYTFSWSY